MYPKSFLEDSQQQQEPGFCFVLMPFDPGFAEVWKIIRSTVESQDFNLECKRADDFSKPGYIMEDILRNIVRASIIIADLTGKNPNVFYELGIAHTVKDSSQVILLSQDVESIPFDLRQLRCLMYREDLTDLEQGLSTTLKEIGQKQYKTTLSEHESHRFPVRVTGDDFCLYEVEVEIPYIGLDAAKVHMRLHRYVGANPPEITYDDIWLLGGARPELDMPTIPWRLAFGGIEADRVTIILRKRV